MSRRNLCCRCQRPASVCICCWATPLHNAVELLILQHPLEVNNAKNTIRLVQLSLSQCQLVIGEQFDPEWLAVRLAEGDKLNLLLYPPTAESQSLGLLPTPPLPDLGLYKPEQLRLVLLDATWRKSRKQLYLNPALQRLPRLNLDDCPPSTYRIRKAQAPHQLSSLEALVYALQRLEAAPDKYAPLLEAFDGFVDQQLARRLTSEAQRN
jgi:DTW domain-containing protein YfiP